MSKRINLTVSDELIDFYQDLSDQMGVPRSTVMVMALKTYMDQQKSLKSTEVYKSIEILLDKVKQLNNESKRQ